MFEDRGTFATEQTISPPPRRSTKESGGFDEPTTDSTRSNRLC